MKFALGFLALIISLTCIGPAFADIPWRVTCNQLGRGGGTMDQYRRLVKYSMEHFMNQAAKRWFPRGKGVEGIDYFLPTDYVEAGGIYVNPWGRVRGAEMFVPRTRFLVTLANGTVEHYSLEMDEQIVLNTIEFYVGQNPQREDYCALMFNPYVVEGVDLQTGRPAFWFRGIYENFAPVMDATTFVEAME
ncbi:MAG TPA: hypothetical protein PKC28_14940 [Bdellovibrionales bacterium]|nr:hypothetical protein [Bdellovibrionales bacterium]